MPEKVGRGEGAHHRRSVLPRASRRSRARSPCRGADSTNPPGGAGRIPERPRGTCPHPTRPRPSAPAVPVGSCPCWHRTETDNPAAPRLRLAYLGSARDSACDAISLPRSRPRFRRTPEIPCKTPPRTRDPDRDSASHRRSRPTFRLAPEIPPEIPPRIRDPARDSASHLRSRPRFRLAI